ncbi:thiamine phosphate synthase [Altererythrobacter soli]|uniref:Thiamine phosphate synthase n=2 Tax=Croceibacterium soli TaxID=1739690 RepID=A0A6I4UN94_9SPHN|nr:thiamine phosphate synthase [Croceibacterium soli]
MRLRYSAGMPLRQTCPEPGRAAIPRLWLLSDARNDAGLEDALRRLPSGSGFVFRHYHLTLDTRRERFDALAELCRAQGHLLILSGDAATAQAWGADGIYSAPGALEKREGLLRLATAHDAHEIDLANQAGADAVFLSPVFPTRSHPDSRCLGKDEFLLLAARAQCPVIALGGMTAERAAELGWDRWGAIDGLTSSRT